jgi:hypothetical protein
MLLCLDESGIIIYVLYIKESCIEYTYLQEHFSLHLHGISTVIL